MQLIGLVLVIIGIYGVYSGVESFNPLALLSAIAQNPSGVNDLIQKEKAFRDSTSVDTFAGDTTPTAVGDTDTQTSVPAATQDSGSLGSFEKANAAVLQRTGSAGNPTPADVAVEQQYAFDVLATTYGITGQTEDQDLVKLWDQESGWRQNADNASSGAYGIPQALPATKIPGGTGSDAQQQIDWGLSYIVGRYKDPAGAWAHEQAENWY